MLKYPKRTRNVRNTTKHLDVNQALPSSLFWAEMQWTGNCSRFLRLCKHSTPGPRVAIPTQEGEVWTLRVERNDSFEFRSWFLLDVTTAQHWCANSISRSEGLGLCLRTQLWPFKSGSGLILFFPRFFACNAVAKIVTATVPRTEQTLKPISRFSITIPKEMFDLCWEKFATRLVLTFADEILRRKCRICVTLGSMFSSHGGGTLELVEGEWHTQEG